MVYVLCLDSLKFSFYCDYRINNVSFKCAFILLSLMCNEGNSKDTISNIAVFKKKILRDLGFLSPFSDFQWMKLVKSWKLSWQELTNAKFI